MEEEQKGFFFAEAIADLMQRAREHEWLRQPLVKILAYLASLSDDEEGEEADEAREALMHCFDFLARLESK